MTTPEQLLERLEAVERGATGPPAGANERVWSAIEARLVNGPAPPELDQAPLLEEAAELAANVGGSSSVVLKVVGALAIVGAIGGGLALLGDREPNDREPNDREPNEIAALAPEQAASVQRASPELELPQPKSLEPESPEAESPEPESPELAEPPTLELGEPSTPAIAKVKQPKPPPAPPETAKTLAEEMALMQAISTALKQGDSPKVLTLVTEHERDFAKGQFIEERRAAKARALCQSGKLAAGKKEASSFASRWPDSIHLTSVKQDCEIE